MVNYTLNEKLKKTDYLVREFNSGSNTKITEINISQQELAEMFIRNGAEIAFDKLTESTVYKNLNTETLEFIFLQKQLERDDRINCYTNEKLLRDIIEFYIIEEIAHFKYYSRNNSFEFNTAQNTFGNEESAWYFQAMEKLTFNPFQLSVKVELDPNDSENWRITINY